MITTLYLRNAIRQVKLLIVLILIVHDLFSHSQDVAAIDSVCQKIIIGAATVNIFQESCIEDHKVLSNALACGNGSKITGWNILCFDKIFKRPKTVHSSGIPIIINK